MRRRLHHWLRTLEAVVDPSAQDERELRAKIVQMNADLARMFAELEELRAKARTRRGTDKPGT
jgi:hypothetical protein